MSYRVAIVPARQPAVLEDAENTAHEEEFEFTGVSRLSFVNDESYGPLTNFSGDGFAGSRSDVLLIVNLANVVAVEVEPE